MLFSSSNRNSAKARAHSVLPTPVGPRKINDPIGRLGSFKPDAARSPLLITYREEEMFNAHVLILQGLRFFRGAREEVC